MPVGGSATLPPGNEAAFDPALSSSAAPRVDVTAGGTLGGQTLASGVTAASQPERAAQARSTQKKMSRTSESTMGQLEDFRRQFDDIDLAVDGIELGLSRADARPGKARDELAQLEARLDKLQCHGVDCVDTSALESGQQEARAFRKELTRRAENMHARMDGLFGRIKHSREEVVQAAALAHPTTEHGIRPDT